jgi:hypothetical protein
VGRPHPFNLVARKNAKRWPAGKVGQSGKG